MNFLKPTLLTLLFTGLLSCENDVDINAEYTEVTSVIGLIDVRTDTQFVKITKTFLDDDQNALQLVNHPDRIYFDSLDVKLVRTSTRDEIVLNKILLPKEPGLFTQTRNEAYFTSEKLTANAAYELVINKPGSKVITTASAIPTNGAVLTKPRPGASGRGSLTLIDIQNNIIDNSRLEFLTSTNVGEYDITLRFNYVEITNNIDSVDKFFDLPLTTFRNTTLEEGKQDIYIFDGNRFFNAFLSTIPTTALPRKELYRFMPLGNVEIIIQSADGEYALYRDVNGPIDGLAQTRPEFTNITNGIGLFASRTLRTWKLDFNVKTINYIINNYGSTGGMINDFSKYRGFYFRGT
ncbi:MAG: DUF4249 family protein [Flavobacteriales bacterium]|nr:DUF4249 family protein [Flavobacteriales bacterium]